MTTNEEIRANIEEHGFRYIVYGDGLGHKLGYANTFSECKALHREWLEEVNHPQKELYAGLNCEGGWLMSGSAFPAFYAD